MITFGDSIREKSAADRESISISDNYIVLHFIVALLRKYACVKQASNSCIVDHANISLKISKCGTETGKV